jgi:hypothetical protein
MTLEQLSQKYGWVFCAKADFPGVNNLSDVVLIFLPTWSQKDVSIIDFISKQIVNTNLPVFVFDLDGFATQEELISYFPCLPMINQSPVVACYVGGSIKVFDQGVRVREISFAEGMWQGM